MVIKKYLRPAAFVSVLAAAQMMTGCANEPVNHEEPSEAVSETEGLYDVLSEDESETEEAETETETEEPIDLSDPEHAENIDRFLRRTMALLGDDFRFPQTTDRLRIPVPEETEATSEEISEEPVEALSEEFTEALTEELTEQVSEAASEELTTEDTEALTEEVTEALAGETSETLAEEATEALAEEATEVLAEAAAETLAEEATETLAEGATETLAEEATETLAEEAAETLAEEATETLAEEATETLAENATESLAEAATETLAEETTETPAGTSAEALPEVPPPDHFRPLEEHFRISGWALPEVQRSPYMLETVLTRQIADYEGTWSVYVRDLSDNSPAASISVNVQPVKSASVMKLFIMAAAYDAMDNHSLARTDEVISRISGMIRASSNTDANLLLEILGRGSMREGIREVNNYIGRSGASEYTRLYNGFDNTDYLFDADHNNTVYPPDCADLLEKIYHRTFSSRKVCNEIENLMIEQETRYKIPKGVANVSEGVTVGNKTGEMDGVENDVAIVYSPACDYILCVFSDGWTDKDTALNHIQSISEQVYRYYNDSRWVEKTIHILP